MVMEILKTKIISSQIVAKILKYFINNDEGSYKMSYGS